MKTMNFFQNKSKAISACLFTVFMLLGFTACSEEDNPVVVNQALLHNVQGQWILINDFLADDDDNAYFDDDELDDIEGIDPAIFDFHREVIHVNFDELGNGSFLFFAVDNNNEPVGGEGDGLQLALSFNYAIQPDGSIKITSKAPIEGFEENDDFRFHYENGNLIADDGKQQFTLHRLSQAEETQMTAWKIALGMGGAMINPYNPNDEDFTPTTWRQQDAIYIYDGKGPETDSKGKKGYTLVPMPWSNLPVQTNLPYGFCNTITPENGWEWVYNLCGNNGLINANFFAVYNKYTGILRFFYYMPENFSTGNDHVWQVSMTDNLAQQSLWGYGLPSGETIKDRSKVAPTGAGTMVNYIAPWVEMKTDDGLIMPNAGWWAFDVDLSLYRPGVNIAKDAIKLQMRSWNISHVSLFSTMTATIDGSLKQTVKESGASASDVAKGVMTGLGAAANIASTIAYFYKGDPGSAFGAIANIFGCGSEFAGIFGGDGGNEPFEAEISLGMNGTIDTQGFIKDAVPTVGVSSPTIQMKDFNSNGNHLGQGVWNIKKFPKVYVVKDCAILEQVPNILGTKLFATFPYFFDPLSVEVELNPDVFPESEIEYVQVERTCGVRAATGMTGTDRQRAGYGLKSRNLGNSSQNLYIMGCTDNNVGDFLTYYNVPEICDYMANYRSDADKKMMTYPAKILETGSASNFNREFVYGRGIKGSFAIEPVIVKEINTMDLIKQGHLATPIMMPALEVNVIVIVKLKGKAEPICFSRNYLPEFETITRDQMNSIAFKLKNDAFPIQLNQQTQEFHNQVLRISIMSETLTNHFQLFK